MTTGSGNSIADITIRNFLTSGIQADRLFGYYLADNLYRDNVAAYLRRWSKRKRCRLDENDLADHVQQALEALLDRAMEGTFGKEGRVSGFLTTVAHHKAVDEIRRRVRWAEHHQSMVEAKEELGDLDDPTEYQMLFGDELDDELMEQVHACYAQMNEDRALVVRIYHQLAVASPDGRVTPDDLLAAVNKEVQSEEFVPWTTVKSRLDRGRTEFRELLKKAWGRDE